MTEIDKLFDENNNENIYLYNKKGEQVEFEQIALIPIKDTLYVILKPVRPIEGLGEDEGLVFEVKTDENETEYLSLVTDESVIDAVFDIYDKLIEEQGDEVYE
jgi:hypothetical protein